MARRPNPRAVRAAALREQQERLQPPTPAVAIAWRVCQYANHSCPCSARKTGRPSACASIMTTADAVLRIAQGEAD